MSKKVLFAVLNWGLGHATRSASIIKELLNNNVDVIIGSDGIALEYLIDQFPKLKHYELPHLNIKYPSTSLMLNMSYQLPKLIHNIRREHQSIKDIVILEQPDIIISDNRYGCYHNHIKSIFITHQLNLPINNKIIKYIANYFIKTTVQKFNECWIPDYETKQLSGNLSEQNLSIPINYIGAISHFSKLPVQNFKIKRDLIVVLSGPEPQRTKLERLLINQLNELQYSVLIVQGNLNALTPNNITNDKIKWVQYLGSRNLYTEIMQSTYIVCRSGYSSVMDLDQIQRSALLIPTPGQNEQEYVGQQALDNGNHYCISQNKIELSNDLKFIPNNKFSQSKKNKLTSFIKQKVQAWNIYQMES